MRADDGTNDVLLIPANFNEVAAPAQDVSARVANSDVTFNGDVDALLYALGVEGAVAELV